MVPLIDMFAQAGCAASAPGCARVVNERVQVRLPTRLWWNARRLNTPGLPSAISCNAS